MNLPKTLSMHAYLPPVIAIPMPAGREQDLPICRNGFGTQKVVIPAQILFST
jgi:hypothetical protein